MYYTVYKITNRINGKYYIGIHKTEDLDDGYMGSGKHLIRSQLKYGIENFEKNILFVYDNPEDMYGKEAQIVNESFISDAGNYNLKVGGFGGFDYINKTLSKQKRKDICSKGGKTRYISREEQGRRIREGHRRAGFKPVSSDNFTFKGRSHSEETKVKMRKPKNQGENNSQFNTKWIYSIDQQRSMRIEKNADIPQGWLLGRKIKF